MRNYRAIWKLVINKEDKQATQLGTHFLAKDVFDAMFMAAQLTSVLETKIHSIWKIAQFHLQLTDIIELDEYDLEDQKTIKQATSA